MEWSLLTATGAHQVTHHIPEVVRYVFRLGLSPKGRLFPFSGRERTFVRRLEWHNLRFIFVLFVIVLVTQGSPLS
jgi:hypothetical protein